MDLNTGLETREGLSTSATSEKKVRTTIYLPFDLHKSAKIYCARNEIALTQLIIDYLKKAVYAANS